MAKTTQNSLLSPGFLARLERLAFSVKKSIAGAVKGERRSKRKGSSVEFADYRDYVQGDDLRHIDWNIYARLDGLYLKLFEEQEELTLHLLLDGSASMGYGAPEKLRFGQQVLASLGYIGLINHDRVCTALLGGGAPRIGKILRGRVATNTLFEHISSFEAEGGTDLQAACRAYFRTRSTRGIAVLISDFFDEKGTEGALRELAASRCEAYAIHVMAPEELDPQLSGDLKLVDAETGNFAEISMSRGLLKRYREHRDAFISTVESQCKRRGVTYIHASSGIPVEELTLQLLRKRGLLK